MNDETGSVTNPILWRHDDVITWVMAHWFPAKTAHFWLICMITWSFLIRSSPNLISMITWGQWQTPFDDVMMTSSLTSRFIDYGRKFSMFAFKGVFDPFRVEIGQIWPQTPWKRIISAFRRAWPHVKIPTRTKVTAKNVTPFYLFQA